MLTVLYDEQCALCRRCRAWLEHEKTFVPVGFLAMGSPEARDRYDAVPGFGSDLVVADETGAVWVGPAAFIMCLWATEQYRPWSYRLSRPALAPFAKQFFHHVSANRGRLGAVVGDTKCSDGQCGHRESPSPVPARPREARCGRCGAVGDADDQFCTDCGTRR